jgi:hypothetical protein
MPLTMKWITSWGASKFALFTNYYLSDQVEEGEMEESRVWQTESKI